MLDSPKSNQLGEFPRVVQSSAEEYIKDNDNDNTVVELMSENAVLAVLTNKFG